MQITTFNPQIIAKDAESAIQLFEALGFKRLHTKKDVGELNITGVTLENEGGFRVDVSQNEQLPVESVTAIRMNVDDFDEAYRLLSERGFKNFYGDHVAEHPSSKSAIMISPSMLTINLVKHIKED